MSSGKILIADDDRNVHESLGIYLKSEGFETVDVYDGAAAVSALDGDISLCVMDIMMPIMNGIDACKEIRKNSQVPIIMLTAKGEEIDRILGLELGADDYITKPFSVRELIARVKALLRRAQAQNDEEGILRVGPLVIDTSNYEAFRNGEKLSLTLKEFELLKLLVISRGKVLTRDFLLDRIWGYEFYGETRTVDVHIRHIRQKLGDDAHYIETIRGVGYKLNDKPEAKV